jgi:hypothetical protein
MVGTCCFDVGSGHVQYSRGFTHILCDVYITYNSCQCHYVQGLGPVQPQEFFKSFYHIISGSRHFEVSVMWLSKRGNLDKKERTLIIKERTILSDLMQDWDQQSASQIITELCGFVTILSGTFLLHATKDMGDSSSTMGSLYFTFCTPTFLLSLSIGLYPMGSNLALTGPGMCLSYLKPLHSCIWLFPIV